LRAAYLCELAGVRIDAESNTAMAGTFLVQQMEWREALDEAKRSADVKQLTALTAATAGERARVIAEIGEAIDQRADHVAAAKLVRQLMFIEKFGDEIRAADEALAHPREASA
jgi:molecular chaperone HscB